MPRTQPKGAQRSDRRVSTGGVQAVFQHYRAKALVPEQRTDRLGSVMTNTYSK